MGHCFDSISDGLLDKIALISYTLKVRPSEIIGWTDSSHMLARLDFDYRVSKYIIQQFGGEHGKGYDY